MAKIVSRSPRIVTAGMNPKSVYSRVISCGTSFPGGLFNAFCYTPSLADRFWLLSIDVWFDCLPGGVNERLRFFVRIGAFVPTDFTHLFDWTEVLPINDKTGSFGWYFWGRQSHFHWDMDVLYTRQGRHFGLLCYANTTNTGVVMASFRISEG